MADKCEEGKTEAEEEKRRWLGNFDGDADGVAQAGSEHGSDSVGAEFQNVAKPVICHEEIPVAIEGNFNRVIQQIGAGEDRALAESIEFFDEAAAVVRDVEVPPVVSEAVWIAYTCGCKDRAGTVRGEFFNAAVSLVRNEEVAIRVESKRARDIQAGCGGGEDSAGAVRAKLLDSAAFGVRNVEVVTAVKGKTKGIAQSSAGEH